MKVLPAILALSAIPLFAQVATNMPTAPKPAQAAPAADTTDPNKVVLTIGDEKITAGQYNDMVNAIPQQYQDFARGPGKRQFADQIVQVKVLSQEAENKKLDQEPKIKDELQFQRQNLLAQAMFLALQQNIKVDDAAVEKYYNEHKQDYESVKARHILIRVKGAPMQATPGKPELSDEEALAKAKDIRAKLVAGGDFAAIAKTESDDTGSGNNGGDLGEFRKGMMVPPFEEAAFAAKVGEVTEPVKTPFGYHLIKVEAHTTKTLAEAKPDIEKKLRPELARAEVEGLQKSAKVTLDPAFFGPEQPAAPAPRPPAAAAPGAVVAPSAAK